MKNKNKSQLLERILSLSKLEYFKKIDKQERKQTEKMNLNES